MDVVIQCASSKDPAAGLFRALDGRDVRFVARPELANPAKNTIFARPDDASDMPNKTWRKRLSDYIANDGLENPFGLSQAYQLYRHKAHEALVKRFGVRHVFILSAGWGLVRADYLIPTYDVTFSRRAKLDKPEAFCESMSHYKYFQQVPINGGRIVFLGGKDYLPLFENLTEGLGRERVTFLRASEQGDFSPQKSRKSLRYEPFASAARTNWHYQCAMALARGDVSWETVR